MVAPTGEIKKLSVAVLVDGTYQAGAKGERQYVPRSAEELAKYREIVKSAVGYNESRGDRVDVADAHFDIQDDPDAAVQGEAQRVFWVQLSGYGVYVILGVLFFPFVWIISYLFIKRSIALEEEEGREAKLQIPNTKPQTNPKPQAPKGSRGPTLLLLGFVASSFFGFWSLGFGV